MFVNKYFAIVIECRKVFCQLIEVFTQQIWHETGAGLLNDLKSEMADAAIRSIDIMQLKKLHSSRRQ